MTVPDRSVTHAGAPARGAAPTHVLAASKGRSSAASRAAYLVLLNQRAGVKALLFNAAHRYLTEVIDDPLVVERLTSAGRPCDMPRDLADDVALRRTSAGDGDILCFALGGH